MPRRGFPARRSATEWTIRGLLAAAIVVAAYFGVIRTLGYALRTGSIERAHALAPDDGRVTALMAQSLLNGAASARDRARMDLLARQALRQDPTAVVAASTGGLVAEIRGNAAEAKRLLAYAERLSRRDMQTQIWAIEKSVDRGDITGALRHYDIALRTSRRAPDILFPVLASAITDPMIRVTLVRTLAAKPLWGPLFIDYVAGSAPDRRAVAMLYIALSRARIPVSEGATAAVVDGLVAQGTYSDAWAYYAAVRPQADRQRSRDPRFNANITTPTPFDWMPVNDMGVSSSIQRGNSGGVFDFAAPASVGGPVLQQRQVLPPGTYRLDGHSVAIDQPPESRPYWTLSCQDGRELGRVVLLNSAQAGGKFVGQFTVPAGCPVQTLALVARSSEMVGGSSGQLDAARLYPIR